MKKLLFFTFFLIITSCGDDFTSSRMVLLNPEDLMKLSIEDLDNFWQDDTIFMDDYKGYFFNQYYGCLGGVKYSNDSTNKNISVYVFNSEVIAIKAMEEYRLMIVAPTFEGNPYLYFNEKWWYLVSPPYNRITVNKYNTLIQVSNTNSSEDIVIETANEIIRRVEKNSKFKEF